MVRRVEDFIQRSFDQGRYLIGYQLLYNGFRFFDNAYFFQVVFKKPIPILSNVPDPQSAPRILYLVLLRALC